MSQDKKRDSSGHEKNHKHFRAEERNQLTEKIRFLEHQLAEKEKRNQDLKSASRDLNNANRSLSKANSELSKANEKLAEANEKLLDPKSRKK